MSQRHPLTRCSSPASTAHVEPERQQVHLYQLFKDFVVRKYTLSVYSRRASISVSDNLLIVHALDSKVALIFDLRINHQFPITAPLPLACIPSEGFSPSYSPHWSIEPPDLVVDPQVRTRTCMCICTSMHMYMGICTSTRR